MSARGVFHEQETAVLVVARLRRDGFEAAVARERFAGEDDDEDVAWAVLSDAPVGMLEILCEQHDGWLEPGDEPAPHEVWRRPPLDLPRAPRRRHGPPGACDDGAQDVGGAP